MKEKQNFIEISNTFGFVLAEILNLINPIIPFVSEKISKDLGFSQESLFFKKINKINDNKNFRVREINEFEKIIKLIKKIRIEATDEINKKIQISLIIISNKKISWIEKNKELLKFIFNFKKIEYNQKIKNRVFLSSSIKFSLTSKTIDLSTKEKEEKIRFFEKEIAYFEQKLKNKNFIAKAPKKIIDVEKKKLADVQKNLKLLKE